MSTTLIIPTIKEFLSEFGEELEMCNEDAYTDLIAISEQTEILVSEFSEIMMQHADELDACHPDAFDVLYELGRSLGIEI